MFEKVLEQPIEDAMVFAQLDTGDIMRAGSEQGHMPKNATEKLEKTWTKLLGDLKKQKLDAKKFSHLVREAAVEFMVNVVGNYRSFVKDVGGGEFDFDFDLREVEVEEFRGDVLEAEGVPRVCGREKEETRVESWEG